VVDERRHAVGIQHCLDLALRASAHIAQQQAGLLKKVLGAAGLQQRGNVRQRASIQRRHSKRKAHSAARRREGRARECARLRNELRQKEGSVEALMVEVSTLKRSIVTKDRALEEAEARLGLHYLMHSSRAIIFDEELSVIRSTVC
jgi:hypothetical protein